MNSGGKHLFCVLIFIYVFNVNGKLEEFLKWKQIPYANLPNNGYNESTFIRHHSILMGVSHYKGRLFLTVPRRQLGIPATLNVLDLNNLSTGDQSPELIGYPNYETNTVTHDFKPNPDRIVSVYRTKVDVCGRLWFVDTGFLEIPRHPVQVQNPSLWAIDLETNQRICRVEIEKDVVRNRAGLASLTVDVDADNCDDAYVYMPDTSLFRLNVYSLRQNKVWTVRHNYFSFDPLAGNLKIAGKKFQWGDGLFSVSLGSKQPNGSRTAYLLPMISTNLFSVSTKVLQNETLATRYYHDDDFKVLGSRGPNRQAAMHDIDLKTGVIFYGELQRSGMGCWNTAKRYTPPNHGTVDRNNETMVFPSDISVDADSTVWMVTNSFPVFLYGRVNENDYSFRVWRGKASELIKGTVCDVSPV